MKYIILGLLVISSFVSCKKDDDGKVENRWVRDMRVSKIVGQNSSWGKFEYKFFYNPITNALDSAFRYNETGRKAGSIVLTKSKGLTTYAVNDYVYAIPSDSISRLDERLKSEYGEGNYSLIDSIPLAAKSLYTVNITTNKGMPETQEFLYYTPREDVGTGKNFNNNYILIKKEKCIYEFDGNGNVLNSRMFIDTYSNPLTPAVYSREVIKHEYNYNSNKIADMNIYTSDPTLEVAIWKHFEKQSYTYSGDNIVAIGGSYNLSATYSGGSLSATTVDGVATKYEFNGKYVSKIERAADDYMIISYESGMGDIYLLSKLDAEQRCLPIVK